VTPEGAAPLTESQGLPPFKASRRRSGQALGVEGIMALLVELGLELQAGVVGLGARAGQEKSKCPWFDSAHHRHAYLAYWAPNFVL
jgi:hypothetical protein